jgi:hypothetical protein
LSRTLTESPWYEPLYFLACLVSSALKAALGEDSVEGDYNRLKISVEDEEFILCNLVGGKVYLKCKVEDKVNLRLV